MKLGKWSFGVTKTNQFCGGRALIPDFTRYTLWFTRVYAKSHNYVIVRYDGEDDVSKLLVPLVARVLHITTCFHDSPLVLKLSFLPSLYSFP